MKIIDLIEEKAILSQRFTSPYDTCVIGREFSIDPQKAREVLASYQTAMKRCDEINDQLNSIMSQTFIKIDNREISVRTALDYIRRGSQLLSPSFGLMGQLPFNASDDVDLYYVLQARIGSQIDACYSRWVEEDDEDVYSSKIVDPNNCLADRDYYRYFSTDYMVRLTMAVQRAVVVTDVE